MIILPRHFVRFIDGRAGNQIVVGFLPGALGVHINTLETNVSLRRDYALKLLKHKIDYHQFVEIQNTIDNGTCLREDEFRLKFLYVKDVVKPIIYHLLLKTDRTRKEVWLQTFHRITKRQFTDRLDPALVLREHIEQEFMG